MCSTTVTAVECTRNAGDEPTGSNAGLGRRRPPIPAVASAPVILSDRSIRKALAEGRIVIEPLDEASVQPSSVDLHVDRYFRVFRNHTMGYIDVKQDMEELTELLEIKEDDMFILHPGEFVLGSTSERVALPDDLVARLEGKSWPTEAYHACWAQIGRGHWKNWKPSKNADGRRLSLHGFRVGFFHLFDDCIGEF